MENENNEVIIDSTETNEETVETQPEETQAEETTEVVQEEQPKEEKPYESPDAKRARLKRQLEQHEKKYGFKTEPKKEVVKTVEPQRPGISERDLIALMKSNIHEDDVDEVKEYAAYKKIGIADALKSSVVKATLAERQEQRTTAQATSTGKARSGSARQSGESLLNKAINTGELPDTDEGLKALIEARRPSKK